MTSRILFISDLHLEAERPDITRTLLHFLETEAGRCSALYILGDLFEVWIGDDDESPLAATVASALNRFADAGSNVWLMHGNRDFLLGPAFASRCGARLLDDPAVIETPTGPLLLLHGDTLCTDDTGYQQFRQQVRDPGWQTAFLAQSLEERRAFARQARQQSQAATSGKSMDIMDVNQDAVIAALRDTGLQRLLHGHTHRPAMHDLTLPDGKTGDLPAQRYVLGSWEDAAWFAESDAAGIRLHHFPLLT